MIDQSNYRFGLPVAASTYANKIDLSLSILHWGMLVMFIAWAGFSGYSRVRFRQSRNPVAQPEAIKGGAVSFLPDALVLGFEIWLVFFLGLPIWAHVKEDMPKAENALVIHMVAEQFAWNFQYAGADGIFGAR